MVHLRKILVTTDLSDFSLAALEFGSSIDLFRGAEVMLLHVVEHRLPHSGSHGEKTASREAELSQAGKALNEFVSKRVPQDLPVLQVVRSGYPAREICRFASEKEVDVILMATHGRTGLKHILMGSVAERVVRHSPAPVITVKPREIRDMLLLETDIEQELHIR